MISDPIVLSEIRALIHQIRITESNGDKDGAASLAWELADALDDAGLTK